MIDLLRARFTKIGSELAIFKWMVAGLRGVLTSVGTPIGNRRSRNLRSV
jgi:hypothetical protein